VRETLQPYIFFRKSDWDVGPSRSFDSPLHTDVSHFTKVVLSFLLGFKLQREAPEVGIMVPTDGKVSFWPSSFAGIGGVLAL
jgi:hypothetical protein